MDIRQFFQIGYSSNDLVQIYNKNWFMEIEEAIVHPDFGAIETEEGDAKLVNDIALIKLKQPLRFSKNVQPACLGIEHQEKYDGSLKVRITYTVQFSLIAHW